MSPVRDPEDVFGESWFADWGMISHTGVAEYADGAAPEASLVGLLHVDPRFLNDFARQLLELPPDGTVGAAVQELRHGVHAYVQFQDLLEVLVDGVNAGEEVDGSDGLELDTPGDFRVTWRAPDWRVEGW
jgi:hypothetical protein